jgi:hypothetical protein
LKRHADPSTTLGLLCMPYVALILGHFACRASIAAVSLIRSLETATASLQTVHKSECQIPSSLTAQRGFKHRYAIKAPASLLLLRCNTTSLGYIAARISVVITDRSIFRSSGPLRMVARRFLDAVGRRSLQHLVRVSVPPT